MAIIAALSVQYSNFGTKILVFESVPHSCNRWRKYEFADTPPAIATWVNPYVEQAFFILCNNISTKECWMDAHKSARHH